MGYRLFQAINTNDFPVIQGITFFLVVSIAVAILVIDLIYPQLGSPHYVPEEIRYEHCRCTGRHAGERCP